MKKGGTPQANLFRRSATIIERAIFEMRHGAASFLQFCIHRDGGAEQARNQTTRLGPNGGIDELALGHFGKFGDDVQVGVGDRPSAR